MAWAHSHAALPATWRDRDGRLWLYFTSRDEQGRSRIGRAAIDPDDWSRPGFQAEPVLDIGPLGAFDDSGVTMSCLVEHADRLLLYYTGWTLGRTVPFFLGVGCAASEDGGASFHRISPAPVLGRTRFDPYMSASPWVLDEGGRLRAWYVSCTEWTVHDREPRHRYRIHYAESSDAVEWEVDGTVAVDYAHGGEYAMGRPCVVRDRDAYRMWFCSRGNAYALCYAQSQDGVVWERGDVGIQRSPRGWDSEMLAYPCVFDHEGSRWMLYNGNGYGRTGIGLARAE